MIQIYDRKIDKIFEEKEYKQQTLEFLYNNSFGRIILKAFVVNKGYSKLNSIYEKSKLSRTKVRSFILENNIDMTEYNLEEYRCFNDFFIRKKKEKFLQVDERENVLISPADSKVQMFTIDKALELTIKGVKYNLEELFKDSTIVDKYRNGICLVHRLAVDDYHRYCFVDKGKVLSRKIISGKLHTVRPIASREKVFRENQREYMELDTEHLGKILYMEVGALQIGKINNHNVLSFEKGHEKGYFSYGGSTIIMVIQKDKVIIDEDIVKMSQKDIEVKVKYGEKIGEIV